MRRILLFAVVVCMAAGVKAQEMKTIQLNRPDMNRKTTVMQALAERQSVREFADKALGMQDLSDLLWAAAGVNRQESGKRTNPTAMNRQEIDVYVCMPEGAYRYDAKAHALVPVAKGDWRMAVAGSQKGVAKAPVSLVIVGNLEAFRGEELMPAVDAGIVSQNISLFCSSAGLATVPRATMDQAKLKEVLKLTGSQRLFLNHPVGYVK